jgi:glycosyltransferase involved in cell wall biosynthesis
MAECYDKAKIKYLLKLRQMFGNHRELAEADVLIFHCPLDLVLLDFIDKPSIYYNHRSGRPTTFMFNKIMKIVEPIRKAVLIRDRDWVNNKLKELLKKPDVIVSNSKFTKRMLKRYFGVDSFVVYPPIDLNHFKPTTSNPSRDYFLSVQRIDWQKRVTVQIEAFRGLREKLLIVGGMGDKRPNADLLRLTEDCDNIKVLGGVADKKLVSLYTNAKATIQTGCYEDFGLVPVESMACGTPVICVDEGGFKETIHSPQLGIRIKKPYIKNLRKAVENFDNSKYNPRLLRKEAEKYGFERFKREMNYLIQLAVRRHNLVDRSSERLRG